MQEEDSSNRVHWDGFLGFISVPWDVAGEREAQDPRTCGQASVTFISCHLPPQSYYP